MATSGSRKVGFAIGRRRQLGLLAVLAVALVPAAIAWACNPQAYLSIPPSVPPGSQLPVSGAFFKGGAAITITIEGGASTSVTTSGNGSFSTSVAAPSAPGSYTVSAVGYEPDGSITAGLPARASFSVGAATTGSGSPTQSGTPSQTGSSTGTQTQSGSAAPKAGRFAEPETPTVRAFARTRGTPARGEGRSKTGSGSVGTVSNGGGVITSAGTQVFAGSVARSERVGIASQPKSAGAGRKGRAAAQATPSARSAASDVWSGFASAKAPSLLGESSPQLEGGASSQLVWGLGLAGLGLLALGAGLALTGARKRRATAG